MKSVKHIAAMVVVVALLLCAAAAYAFEYKANKEHLGGDLTPKQALEMVMKDPAHTFVVDCRTRPEYQLVGHAEGAYNVPINFWSNKLGEKGYTETPNPNFGQDLLKRFNPKTDTLLMICRSGNRSCQACNEAIKAGFDEAKVFNVMGGFEGGKDKDKDSPTHGKRTGGSWKNEGQPWTYSMSKDLLYQPDVQ
ncbi:MAG: sulfurtransferase [Desulfovibrionaceae bacterium]|nr:sulfurtransferase [Desulfovibrionaceae bacterium]